MTVGANGALGGAGIIALTETNSILVAGALSPGGKVISGDNGALSFYLNSGANLTFGTGSTTGRFTVASSTGYDSASYTAVFAQSGNDYALSFSPEAIPEASTWVLLAVAPATITLQRRSRFFRKTFETGSKNF